MIRGPCFCFGLPGYNNRNKVIIGGRFLEISLPHHVFRKISAVFQEIFNLIK
jgi:hypothetical protein